MDFSSLATSVQSVFGESITYAPYSGEPVSITATFLSGAELGQPETTGPVSMSALQADFDQVPVPQDYVTRGSTRYRVTDVRQDDVDGTYRFSLTEVR